ncbi:hypothetical protein TNCV_4554041 [Trichonephila clavipes]|nr:hypothetical protein TNCV_4554041 [Trichonephila clavipes]
MIQVVGEVFLEQIKNQNVLSRKPAGWRSWFAAGLVLLRLRVRPRPKLVDFHDAENRSCPCLMIIGHVKEPLSACLALMLSEKLKS